MGRTASRIDMDPLPHVNPCWKRTRPTLLHEWSCIAELEYAGIGFANWATDLRTNSLFAKSTYSKRSRRCGFAPSTTHTGRHHQRPVCARLSRSSEWRELLWKDLEKALIDNLQQFLLELGRGFSFVSRQYRFKTDNENYYVDLVFYNFILKCFVLIDLKVGKLTYQDIGQMDFYTRYFEENIRTETDNPTIGIVLCTERDNTIVKYSVMNDSNQLFASKYKLYLPTEEELINELETSRKQIENNVK